METQDESKIQSGKTAGRKPQNLYSEGELMRVLEAFFRDHKTRAEIADIYNLSRPLVAQMIETAERDGTVRIQISPKERPLYLAEWETMLRKRFGLAQAIVVPGHHDSLKLLKHNENTSSVLIEIASAAADYFSRQLIDDQVIAVGAGSVLSSMIKRVRPSRRTEGLRLTPMAGFVSIGASATSASSNCRNLNQILQGTFEELPCPALINASILSQIALQSESQLIRDGFDPNQVQTMREIISDVIFKDLRELVGKKLMQKGFNLEQIMQVDKTIKYNLSLREIVRNLPLVKEALQTSARADVVLTSIGVMSGLKYHDLRRYGVLSTVEEARKFRKMIKEKEVVGEICGWLFDRNGDDVEAPWRTIGIELEPMRRRIREGNLKVIAVVGTDQKRFAAVLGALRGGLITDLVTDAVTAEEVLRLDNSKN